MRHTVEEKRRMRNARKKRKSYQKSEQRRAVLIQNAIKDVKAQASQQRDVASKYYKLWKRSVAISKNLQTKLANRENTRKIVSVFLLH